MATTTDYTDGGSKDAGHARSTGTFARVLRHCGFTPRGNWVGPTLNFSFCPDFSLRGASVFTRDTDGTLRHFYSGHHWLAEDITERGIDELNPIWNVLDLTPQGRGTFYASLEYGTKAHAARS